VIGPRVSLSLDGLTLELNEAKSSFMGLGINQSREVSHVPAQGKIQGADGGLQQGQLLYDPRLKWEFDVIMRPSDYDIFYTIWDRHEWYRTNYFTPRNFIRFDNQRVLYEESGTRSTSIVPGTTVTTTSTGVSYFASWFVNLRLPEKHYNYIGNSCTIEGRQYAVKFKLDYLARIP
jgi:hypothetical protein